MTSSTSRNPNTSRSFSASLALRFILTVAKLSCRLGKFNLGGMPETGDATKGAGEVFPPSGVSKRILPE